MADFDTELNVNLHQNVQDTQTMTVADITGGVTATVVDVGASLWNSLPGTPEVETGDLLSRIDNNALRVYQENPDTIRTASFIGGMFLPAGLAVKGMNIMRNGSKAVNWFTNAGRTEDLAKVGELFRNAGAATSEYRALQKSIFAKTAVNQAIDAVAAEVAILGLYNAHPYMEDYMKDPVQNFALSSLMGGTLGAGIGVVADRFVLKSITGKVAEDVLNEAIGGLRTVNSGMTNAVQIQSFEKNILNLESILETRRAAGKNETNDLLYQVAQATQLTIKREQVELFESMISTDIKAFKPEQKDQIMRMIIDKPEMFGANSMALLTEKELTANNLIKSPATKLVDKPTLKKIDPIDQTETSVDAVFFSDLNLYGTKKDAIHYAGAATLGLSAEKLAKNLPYNYGKIPNLEHSLELAAKSAAHIEGEYIAAMKRVQGMSIKELENLNIGDTDGPLLNAVILRMLSDPAAMQLQVKVADKAPLYKQVISKHTQELVSQGKLPASAASAGPDSSYKTFVDKLAIDIDKYRPSGSVKYVDDSGKEVNVHASTLISAWIRGNKMQLNELALHHLASTVGGYAKGHVDINKAKVFDALYNSKESKALRAYLKTIADADGNIFLYRGWGTDKLQGKQMLDSYTMHVEKAAQFSGAKYGSTARGNIRLYKIPVDDVVAGFEDVGGGKWNDEIIVRSSARPAEAILDATGKKALYGAKAASSTPGASVKTTIETTTTDIQATGGKKLGLFELQDQLILQKQEAIDSLLANGIPFESIAKKTNTDLNVVKAYSLAKGSTQGVTLKQFTQPNKAITASLNNIKNYDDIEKTLAPTNRPLLLKGNLRKNALYTENHIALDNRAIKNLNNQFLFTSLYSSKASAALEMAETLYGPEGFGVALDVLAARLGKMNNELAGSAFFNSFDFFARNMGEAGPIVSAFGKKVQQISNNMIKSVTTPIVEAMTAVQKDAGALVEYSTFFNINSSLAGWRSFTTDGKLVQKVMKTGPDGKPVEVLEPVKYQGKDYQVMTPSVRKLILEQQAKSAELKSLTDTLARIKGTPPVNDIGLWIPSFNPVNKFIAYVHDKANDTTKLLVARTAQEYENTINAYKKYLLETGQAENIRVVTKKEQADWNLLNGRLDPIHMERADISMQKTGASAQAIVKPDLALFGEIAGGYEHYITAQVRNLTDLSISEITDPLRKMSTFNRRLTDNQPLSEVKKAVTQPKDTAAIIRNVLLGGSNLGEYAGWASTNKSFETGLNMAANAISDVWAATIKPLTRTFLGKGKDINIGAVRKIDYVKFSKELDKRGISYPWKQFDEEAAKQFGPDKAWFAMPEAEARKQGFFNIERNPDTTKRVIFGSNALAATMALRFGELAQPLVNMLSMPILTGLAIAQKMPETFMGVQKGTVNVTGVQVMYEGIRAMNSPIFKSLNAQWEKLGYFSPMVSEASDIIRATRKFDKGAVAAVENSLDSSIVQVMSKPADYAETLTRKAAMNTGAVLAKRLYPELDDVGITIFARDFMDKAVGNFHASQRPVLFQGTLGVALGLFQTYTLTLGQSVYRHLELKNYKALGKAALTQSTIFGGQSLPGFDQVSHMIGDHFSDDNVDLTTGTYRAINDKMADFILYGLPSNLGPALNTRGDVDPRLPLLNNPPVAYNFVAQTMTMMGQVAGSMSAETPDKARAFLQALSLQSMSRPVARMAELGTGYSITQRGNTIQTPEEVWSFTGIAARLMATRPLEEQKLREADHLNHFYGAVDRDNRESFIKELRTSIRNGTLTEEKLAKASDGYLRNGGSPAGWRAAYNTAIAKTDAPGKEVFIDKLKPDNPLNFMINNLD